MIHGKTSSLFHSNQSLFFGLPQGFQVTRYHSLVADVESIPQDLEVLAWTQDEHLCFDEIMAVRHRRLPLYGVQFHPEVLLTEHGYDILSAFFTREL